MSGLVGVLVTSLVFLVCESPEESVTVRIENRTGMSTTSGSGAIVGTDGHYALILTCDHLWNGRNGIGQVSVWGHEWKSSGKVIARDNRNDLSFVITKSAPNMPVAKFHIRETKRGDEVKMIGFGGNARLTVRPGTATDNRWITGWSRDGDSGGPAFVDGMLVGVVVAKSMQGIGSVIVPLRHIYSLGMPIKTSVSGSKIYQKNCTELVGLFGRFFGRGKFKMKGKGYCEPDGCYPFNSPDGGSPEGFSGPPQGEPWFAPGFGPGDQKPDDPEKVSPEPDGGVVEENPGNIEIDLSGLIQREEFDRAIDSLGNRINGLASKDDIGRIVSQVDNLAGVIETNLINIDGRFKVIELSIEEQSQPIPISSPIRHYVVIADSDNSILWHKIIDLVNNARTSGIAIQTVDSNWISGNVGAPQLIAYTGEVPSNPVLGEREVANELYKLSAGD